jgi:hypothetical protein
MQSIMDHGQCDIEYRYSHISIPPIISERLCGLRWRIYRSAKVRIRKAKLKGKETERNGAEAQLLRQVCLVIEYSPIVLWGSCNMI